MSWLLPLSCVSAALCGVGGALSYLDHQRVARHRKMMREALSRERGSQAPTLASSGLSHRILQLALEDFRQMQALSLRERRQLRLISFASGSYDFLVQRAGLDDQLDRDSLLQTRMKLCLGAIAAGALFGIVLSAPLSFILACVGCLVGFQALPWALRTEAKARSESVERDLSSMLEVMILGLRSGLSFDRSLQLYCEHFATPLATSMNQARHRWEWGLMAREQSLRQLAASYDSKLLSRVIESMVRSLRFGVSVAAVLDEASHEARGLYKARVEEQVAKAPVKMMLPVGTLILPAMLLLILGPVLLELMDGF